MKYEHLSLVMVGISLSSKLNHHKHKECWLYFAFKLFSTFQILMIDAILDQNECASFLSVLEMWSQNVINI